jgi:ABC-type xylose transport system permease subunit
MSLIPHRERRSAVKFFWIGHALITAAATVVLLAVHQYGWAVLSLFLVQAALLFMATELRFGRISLSSVRTILNDFAARRS